VTELNEEETSKTIGQFILQGLNPLMEPLRKYGQGDYVNSVIPEIVKLAWQLHWKLEGLDIPYEIDDIHW